MHIPTHCDVHTHTVYSDTCIYSVYINSERDISTIGNRGRGCYNKHDVGGVPSGPRGKVHQRMCLFEVCTCTQDTLTGQFVWEPVLVDIVLGLSLLVAGLVLGAHPLQSLIETHSQHTHTTHYENT